MNRTIGLALLLICQGDLFGQFDRRPMDRPVNYVAPFAGDAVIPRELRIRNTHDNCVWAAAETITTAAGWDSFKGITQRAAGEGWRGAGMDHVIRAYQAAGIQFRAQSSSDRSAAIFQEAMQEGVGCYFQVPGHALVCVGIDESTVRIIDSNGPPEIQLWSRGFFDRVREGGGCFPLRRRPVAPACPSCPRPPADHPSLTPEKPSESPKPPAAPPEISVQDLARLIAEAVRNELGSTPVKPGKDGRDGLPGPRGEPGPAGPPGKDADFAAIAALQARVEALEKALTAGGVLRIKITPK